MLGEQIYEAKGQITGTRVLDAEQFKMESSYMGEGKIREIEVMQIGTFWSVPRAGGAVYGEDKTIVMTKMEGVCVQSAQEESVILQDLVK